MFSEGIGDNDQGYALTVTVNGSGINIGSARHALSVGLLIDATAEIIADHLTL